MSGGQILNTYEVDNYLGLPGISGFDMGMTFRQQMCIRDRYRLSGVKKSFTLPENELRKEIEKQNRHRGVFTPTDHKLSLIHI